MLITTNDIDHFYSLQSSRQDFFWNVLADTITVAKTSSLSITPGIYLSVDCESHAVSLPWRYGYNLLIFYVIPVLILPLERHFVIHTCLEGELCRRRLCRRYLTETETATLADAPRINNTLLGQSQGIGVAASDTCHLVICEGAEHFVSHVAPRCLLILTWSCAEALIVQSPAKYDVCIDPLAYDLISQLLQVDIGFVGCPCDVSL